MSTHDHRCTPSPYTTTEHTCTCRNAHARLFLHPRATELRLILAEDAGTTVLGTQAGRAVHTADPPLARRLPAGSRRALDVGRGLFRRTPRPLRLADRRRRCLGGEWRGDQRSLQLHLAVFYRRLALLRIRVTRGHFKIYLPVFIRFSQSPLRTPDTGSSLPLRYLIPR